VLAQHGIDVPWQCVVEPGDPVPDIAFPAFVKPRFESESTGVAESSVVLSRVGLRDRVAYVHREFHQSAVVEEYLPGREFTVAVVGNGHSRGCYSVENVINPAAYTRFPVITKELKLEGWLDFRVPYADMDRLHVQAAAAAAALGCCDHVRLDVREDMQGRIKVIEVNGIPGLNPINSRSLVIYGLYQHSLKSHEVFRMLVKRMVLSAGIRYRLLSEGHLVERRVYRADRPLPDLS
jgi:D-alanine-D-alanine ligase